MTEALRRFRRVHVVIGVVVAALATFGAGQMVSAHTAFDSSIPADGALVEGPVTEVAVNFTHSCQPSGDGFALLDPTGTVRVPAAVDSADGKAFVLTFDPALEPGTYGLRWNVQAGDAHPIDGSFQFEVSGPAATDIAAAASPSTVPPADSATAIGSTDDSESSASLQAFLDRSSPADETVVLGRVGRGITMLGMIFGVGVLAALVWTIRGNRDELETQLAWIRLAGMVVLAGGLLELAALRDGDPTVSITSLITAKPGLATALKMAGGLAVFLGFHRQAGRVVAPALSLSAAIAVDLAHDVAPTAPVDQPRGEHRWTPTVSAAVGLAGYALVLASFWFDGHTMSRGPWALHSLLNLVHIGAAAVWGGGVFAMTTVAWMRRRRSERVGLAAMVVRFSSLATVSLTAVIAAGLLMTWMILDAPGDLFGTQWGRLLVAKTAIVAVAAAMGGYNHFRLRPALEQRGDDPALAKKLRVSLSIESALLVGVVGLTAVLVASAT